MLPKIASSVKPSVEGWWVCELVSSWVENKKPINPQTHYPINRTPLDGILPRRYSDPTMAYPLLLHAKHQGATVTYQAFGGWIVPWRSGTFEQEYQTLRTGVGLVDYSSQALIEVTGADRASFLHNLLTNDVKRLAPGTGCPAALLTANAKLIADVLIFAESASLWLLCDANRAAVIAQTLNQYLFAEQVTITNHERAWAVLALQGPRTLEWARPLVGPAAAWAHPGDHLVASVEGLSVRWIRHSLVGDSGLLCLCPVEHVEQMWVWLQQRGRSVGLAVVGWEALNTARIEAGLPWYGIDMDDTNLLPETGLELVAVSDTKGCYLGQEIIARMQTYGSANKKLLGLLCDGDQAPAAGDRIFAQGAEVGVVTSGCVSPTLSRPIGMGYLKRGAHDPGTAVEILHGRDRIAATAAERPLVRGPGAG